jgi:hypothetical protein
MSRTIFLLAVIGILFDSAGAAELMLVNKTTGAEIGLLKAGVEFELEGVIYIVGHSPGPTGDTANLMGQVVSLNIDLVPPENSIRAVEQEAERRQLIKTSCGTHRNQCN